MHDDLLAIAPYALLSIAAMVTGVLFCFAVALHIRPMSMLIGAATFVMLGVWFGGIAVTAGPAPVVQRGQVADLLRWFAALIAAVWLLWLVSYTWSLIHIRRS